MPAFGDPDAWLAIVGLAPGMRGANRTGRPFTGDAAGELLYETLLKFGLAEGNYGASRDDGFRLKRCDHSQHGQMPAAAEQDFPAEEANCRPYLMAAIERCRSFEPSLPWPGRS